MFVEVPGADADQIPTHYPVNNLCQQTEAVFAMMERGVASLPILRETELDRVHPTGETFRADEETLANIGLDMSVLLPLLAKLTEPELNAVGEASLGSALYAVYRREIQRRVLLASEPRQEKKP